MPDEYTPTPAGGAQIQKNGETWALILTRDLRHAPEKVWRALTEQQHLREWAPFQADADLGTAGALVTLTWAGTGRAQTARVIRSEAFRLLELDDMRWELEALPEGTRLTLWHNIDRRYIAWGAAGWHISLDGLDRLLKNASVGPVAALKSLHWQRLRAEYAVLLSLETVAPPPGVDR